MSFVVKKIPASLPSRPAFDPSLSHAAPARNLPSLSGVRRNRFEGTLLDRLSDTRSARRHPLQFAQGTERHSKDAEMGDSQRQLPPSTPAPISHSILASHPLYGTVYVVNRMGSHMTPELADRYASDLFELQNQNGQFVLIKMKLNDFVND